MYLNENVDIVQFLSVVKTCSEVVFLETVEGGPAKPEIHAVPVCVCRLCKWQGISREGADYLCGGRCEKSAGISGRVNSCCIAEGYNGKRYEKSRGVPCRYPDAHLCRVAVRGCRSGNVVFLNGSDDLFHL